MKSFEQVFDTLPATGWLSEAEARLLWSIAEKTEGPILEVGCYHGRSTCLLAAFGRVMYCVDPFDDFDSELSGAQIGTIFGKNLADRGIKGGLILDDQEREGVNLFVESIEDWRARPVGLAYLDGDHTYQGTLDQIEKAQACKPSIIAVHDVNDSGGGLEVKRAAVELLGAWDERIERLAIWTQ